MREKMEAAETARGRWDERQTGRHRTCPGHVLRSRGAVRGGSMAAIHFYIKFRRQHILQHNGTE